VARPLSARNWHLERKGLSALDTVWCRAQVSEILYRCSRSSRIDLGDLSSLVKNRISARPTSCEKGIKKKKRNCCTCNKKRHSREGNLPISQKIMHQMSNVAFFNEYVIYAPPLLRPIWNLILAFHYRWPLSVSLWKRAGIANQLEWTSCIWISASGGDSSALSHADIFA